MTVLWFALGGFWRQSTTEEALLFISGDRCRLKAWRWDLPRTLALYEANEPRPCLPQFKRYARACFLMSYPARASSSLTMLTMKYSNYTYLREFLICGVFTQISKRFQEIPRDIIALPKAPPCQQTRQLAELLSGRLKSCRSTTALCLERSLRSSIISQ